MPNEPKKTKNEVNYSLAKPNGDKCKDCMFFIKRKSKTEANNCRRVRGAIDPDGWCELWKSKQK